MVPAGRQSGDALAVEPARGESGARPALGVVRARGGGGGGGRPELPGVVEAARVDGTLGRDEERVLRPRGEDAHRRQAGEQRRPRGPARRGGGGRRARRATELADGVGAEAAHAAVGHEQQHVLPARAQRGDAPAEAEQPHRGLHLRLPEQLGAPRVRLTVREQRDREGARRGQRRHPHALEGGHGLRRRHDRAQLRAVRRVVRRQAKDEVHLVAPREEALRAARVAVGAAHEGRRALRRPRELRRVAHAERGAHRDAQRAAARRGVRSGVRGREHEQRQRALVRPARLRGTVRRPRPLQPRRERRRAERPVERRAAAVRGRIEREGERVADVQGLRDAPLVGQGEAGEPRPGQRAPVARERRRARVDRQRETEVVAQVGGGGHAAAQHPDARRRGRAAHEQLGRRAGGAEHVQSEQVHRDPLARHVAQRHGAQEAALVDVAREQGRHSRRRQAAGLRRRPQRGRAVGGVREAQRD